VLAPQPLEIARHAARPRAGDEQVAGELEVEGDEPRVGAAVADSLEALVGRELRGVGLAEVQLDAAEEPSVLGHRGVAERCIRLLRRGGDLRGAGLAGLLVVVGGGGSDEQRHRVGPLDAQRAVLGRNGAALGDGLQARLKRHALVRLALVGRAAQHEAVLPEGRHIAVLGPRHADAEGQAAGLIAGQPHDEHLVGGTGEHLAGERGVAAAEGRARDGRIEIEVAPVVAHLGDLAEVEPQVAEGLVAPGCDAGAHDLALHEGLALGVLAVEDELAGLLDRVPGALAIALDGMASPQGVLVELDVLAADAAEHHGAQPPVADGQGLGPLACRLAIPQRQLALGRRRLADEGRVGRASGVLRALRVVLGHLLSLGSVGVRGPLRPRRVIACAELPVACQAQGALRGSPTMPPRPPWL